MSTAPLFRAETATPAAAAAAPSGPYPFTLLGSSWDSQNLLGDMWGLRPALGKYGVTLSITENAETFGNVTGGVRKGFEVNGLTTATVQLDTQKAFGLNGGLFNVSGLHIWGGFLGQSNLLNLQSPTGIEAFPSVRLWELWYQQKFGDKFDIKIGEQSLDQEYMIAQDAAVFLNAAFGWPVLPTQDLPGGGPAYPLAGLGVRAHAQVTDAVAVLAGIYNGSPIPLNSPNTQISNPNGVSFPLNTGVLAIAELQFAFPGSGSAAKPDPEGPLPGTYKFGGWYDSEDFDDQEYDNLGLPLASPLSDGVPAKHQGNYSLYAVGDQMIWRAKDPNQNLSVFVRPMFTSLQDRNLIAFSIDGGLTMHEPFAGRANDIFGLGFGVARVSTGAAAYDRDEQFFNPSVYTPVRSTETFVEATYQIQIFPWWQLQTDVQYIANPGAAIANPNEPTQKIKNELVFGLRTNLTF